MALSYMKTSLIFALYFAGSLAFPTSLQNSSNTTLPELCSAESYNIVNNSNGTWPYRSYQTTNLTSPVLNITTNSPNLSPGFIFFDVGNIVPTAEHQEGPYAMSSDGDLVWSGATQGSNFWRQTWYDEEVITYWTTTSASGGGYGKVVILNNKYEVVGEVCPKIQVMTTPGTNTTCVADIHESYITATNTMIITVYNITTTDLTSVGGPSNGWVTDCLAVEVDIETNEVLWSWSALEHVPVSASKLALGTAGQNSSDPWSWFHMNSIQPVHDHVLVNSRETWTSYYISKNGTIEWTLNGENGGDFGPLPAGANFSWQHHARIHPSPSNTSQFLWTAFADNNDFPGQYNESIAMGLLLEPGKPATIHTQLKDPSDLLAAFAEGSYQLLHNGSAFAGFGTNPVFKEFDSEGVVVYSADFAYRNLTRLADSYRAFKQEWHARPAGPVALVVKDAVADGVLPSCANSEEPTGYISWNGATDVEGYIVLTGSDEDCMEPVGRVEREGFETAFAVPGNASFVQVQAMEKGCVVGASSLVSVS